MRHPRYRKTLIPAVVLIAFFLLFIAAGARAAQITVPTDYPSIQAAINAASPGDDIVVLKGTYVEAITLSNGITVSGEETARTFLSMNNGAGPIVTVSSSVSATISTFTFINAGRGILVSNDNSSTVNIVNNVFQMGTAAGSTAILVQNSPNTMIVNNTFNGNSTAVSEDADLSIINNIFANNGTAITGFPSAVNINSNLFFQNGVNGPTGTSPVMGDPLFVDPLLFDFHVEEGSPCINAGDPSVGDNIIDGTLPDIGAYGGPYADPTPFPVQGLTITANSATSIALSWFPNNSYLVTNDVNPGGYTLYYGYASGNYNGTDADSGQSPSPITVGPFTTYTMLDLNPSSLVPSTPVLNQLIPGNQELLLSWSTSTNATGNTATGYKVHYGVSSPAENTIDVGNTTSYTLTGLTNGQSYEVAVSAYSDATYYMVVTCYDNTPAVHESDFSKEVSVQLGQPESGLSNIQTNYPDVVLGYPSLPNSGGYCFIATAAYGSYSAPEVRVLRAFRDRYLLTSATGRLFVQWYYRYGPAAATLLNAHPAFKPAVRVALMPAVAAAIILTKTTAMFKLVLMLILGLAIASGFIWKRLNN